MQTEECQRMKVKLLLVAIACLILASSVSGYFLKETTPAFTKKIRVVEPQKQLVDKNHSTVIQKPKDDPPQGNWSDYSPYWCIIQIPIHNYQLEQGTNIITLTTTLETNDTTISALGYHGDHIQAREDGLIGYICEYDGSPHFPTPAKTFIPGQTYQVTAYQPCYWGFPLEDERHEPED